MLNLSYSTSKNIIQVYKKENRIGKKEHKPKVNHKKKPSKKIVSEKDSQSDFDFNQESTPKLESLKNES